MAVSRQIMKFCLVVILILGAGVWIALERMATNIEDTVSRRYENLAVRTLSQKALLEFESRSFPGGTRKYWHQGVVSRKWVEIRRRCNLLMI